MSTTTTPATPAPRPTGGSRHNLGTVIAFEFLRTVRKPRFWIISLTVPLLIGLVYALVAYSSRSTDKQVQDQKQASITFSYRDQSGVIDPDLAKQFGGTPVTDAASARQGVQDGSLKAFFDYPKDLATGKVQVYGQDLGVFKSGDYTAVAAALAKASVAKQIGKATSPTLATVAMQGVSTDLTTYRAGTKVPGMLATLLPGLFLVLFYLALLMLGNQMLNVTLEEKENRVTEMILTTMNPTTLIVGKVIGLILIGLVQALVFGIPIAVLLLFFPDFLHLPHLSWADVGSQAGPMLIGFLLFAGGFLMFASILVSIGAIMPSAKEAGSAFGAVMVAMFVPLYAASLIVTKPHGMVSNLFTYIPITAPITSLLRNATGGLSWWEALIVIVELFVFAGLMLQLGVRLFRTGSISYGSRLDVRKALALGRRD